MAYTLDDIICELRENIKNGENFIRTMRSADPYVSQAEIDNSIKWCENRQEVRREILEKLEQVEEIS